MWVNFYDSYYVPPLIWCKFLVPILLLFFRFWSFTCTNNLYNIICQNPLKKERKIKNNSMGIWLPPNNVFLSFSITYKDKGKKCLHIETLNIYLIQETKEFWNWTRKVRINSSCFFFFSQMLKYDNAWVTYPLI